MEEKIYITVIRSRRKTMAIEITRDRKVLVRVPMGAPHREVEAFVQSRKDWIRKTLLKLEMQEAAEPAGERLSMEEIRDLASRALKWFPGRVAYYAPLVGVSYGRITVRNQKTRWGSCSAKKNLNFNWKLMLAPPDVLDYVVVHELCHLVHMDHSQAFWALVGSVLPDYRVRRRWLKEHGDELML